MSGLKDWLKTPAGMGVGMGGGVLAFFMLVMVLLNNGNTKEAAQKMQSEQTQPIQANVRYTTAETMRTLSGQVDNSISSVEDIKKNQQKQAQEIAELKDKRAESIEVGVKAQLANMMVKLQAKNESKFAQLEAKIKQGNQQSSSQDQNHDSSDGEDDSTYHVSDKKSTQQRQIADNGNGHVTQDTAPLKNGTSDLVWVGDDQMPARAIRKNSTQGSVKAGELGEQDSTGLLNDEKAGANTDKKDLITNKVNDLFGASGTTVDGKVKAIPMYTIPTNTWLTGVIAEQPLIGIVPIDGKVVNPRTMSFAVQSKNLAANNWQLPANLKNIQGDSVCQGFFAVKNSAVTCSVTSLTFIFNDGTIVTKKAKDGKYLGTVTDNYGNPQIRGTLHSNLGYFLGGTALFSGVQGYGGALSAAQMATQTSAGQTISNLIGNANTYAEGQGLSTAARAAQQWWVDRMKSARDFVYVPNWNPQTHHLLQLNVKITQPIDIDYNRNGRRVSYENSIDETTNNSLD